MLDLVIKMTKSKTLIAPRLKLGDKRDYCVVRITLDLPLEYDIIENKYIIMTNPDTVSSFIIPLTNNSFIVTNAISDYPGQWGIVFLATTNKIVDGVIVESDIVCASDKIFGTIVDNELPEHLEDEPIDPNLKTVYDQMNASIQYINSTTFQDIIYNKTKDYVDAKMQSTYISELKTEIEADINLPQIEINKQDIATIKTEITTIQTNIQTNTTNISKNTTAIEALTTTVNDISSTLVANNTTLTAILGGGY